MAVAELELSELSSPFQVSIFQGGYREHVAFATGTEVWRTHPCLQVTRALQQAGTAPLPPPRLRPQLSTRGLGAAPSQIPLLRLPWQIIYLLVFAKS